MSPPDKWLRTASQIRSETRLTFPHPRTHKIYKTEEIARHEWAPHTAHSQKHRDSKKPALLVTKRNATTPAALPPYHWSHLSTLSLYKRLHSRLLFKQPSTIRIGTPDSYSSNISIYNLTSIRQDSSRPIVHCQLRQGILWQQL